MGFLDPYHENDRGESIPNTWIETASNSLVVKSIKDFTCQYPNIGSTAKSAGCLEDGYYSVGLDFDGGRETAIVEIRNIMNNIYRFIIPVVAVQRAEILGDGDSGVSESFESFRQSERTTLVVDVESISFHGARQKLQQALARIASES